MIDLEKAARVAYWAVGTLCHVAIIGACIVFIRRFA